MEVNLEYANAALAAACAYREAMEKKDWKFGAGDFFQFKLQGYDISDVMTSLLHLTQQLQNEGEEVVPELVWTRAWTHFDAEVLHPDDIELGEREVRKQKEAKGETNGT